MNKWQKAGLVVGLTGAVFATAHIINKMVFAGSVSRNVTKVNDTLFYSWKFGNIAYIKRGSGSPVLLVHDLMPYSSSYEWKDILDKLAAKHTVYAIDLLGCGHSDKPNITYTTYLYVQLLSDFVKNVIGKRTDIIATGDSVPMAVMSCYSDASLYGNLIFINPENINKSMLMPRKNSNIIRGLLNSPIIGTMIYNVCMCKNNIKALFSTEFFSNKKTASTDILNAYHENAHLGGSKAKCLYTSIACRYTTAGIAKAVSEINNSIFIIGGGQVDRISSIIRGYFDLNSSIEFCVMEGVKKLPQLENPQELLKQLAIFL